MVPSCHKLGEHFVSSALASGCILVDLEKAPFHSLRLSLPCRCYGAVSQVP